LPQRKTSPKKDVVLLPLASSLPSALAYLAALNLDTTQHPTKATNSSPPPPQWCRNQFWPSSSTPHDIVPSASLHASTAHHRRSLVSHRFRQFSPTATHLVAATTSNALDSVSPPSRSIGVVS